MNAIDVAIVLAIIIMVTVGFMQGLLRQATLLLALYLSAVLAIQYHTVVGGWLAWMIPSDPAPRASVGFLLIFIWGVLFLGWLTYRVYPETKIMGLGLADNVIGAVLGLVAGTVAVSIAVTGLFFAISVQWPNYDHARVALDGMAQSSRLLPIVDSFAPTLYVAVTPWFPNGMPAILAQFQ
ncbi:MAG: CvpA family protein [Chloroflexota bacterium]